LVGLFTALALVAIVVGVSGVELSLPRIGASVAERAPLPGVRAVAASALLRVGAGAPPGGELAFLAVEPSGNLVVSDSKRHTVMRFDPSGHLLSEWGPRFGDTTLTEPAGVAVQGDNFYVLDRGTPRIFRLDAAGRLQATLTLETLGTYGLNGLAADLAGNLYAADTGRNRILVLSPIGQLIREVGHGGADLGGLTQPWMVAFAPGGGFFVADWENSRVEGWNTNFEATDAWSTGFHPSGVAIDQTGRLFVPDTDRRRIEVYSAQGAVLGEMGVPGSPPIEVAPKQVAISRADRLSLYVLGGDGIVRLDLENTAPPPQGGAAEVDFVSLAILGLLIAVMVFAVLSRRSRRASPASLGATLDRPVGL
jgi:DNA-binding beta-propeller fold protein YncE